MNRKTTKNQSFEFDENDNPITTGVNLPTPIVPENKELKEVNNPSPEFEDLIDKDMLELMFSTVSDYIVKTKEAIKVSKEDSIAVVNKLAQFKDVSGGTCYISLSELFRIGGANAGAASSLSVPMNCPVHQTTNCYMTKYDVANAMQIVLGHKNVRKLAEVMAPTMLAANIRKVESNPELDLRGNLANRINRKLINKNLPTLTKKEEICCTYSQWLPNLDNLAESKTLKALLEDDLASRKRYEEEKNQ